MTNRFFIDEDRVHRSDEDVNPNPKIKFQRNFHRISRNHIEPAIMLGLVRNFNASEMTWRVLNKVIELSICSANYYDGKFNPHPSIGVTETTDLEDTDKPIRVLIGAEVVWPLLVGNFSESEKMMVRFVFATTLVHEIMVSIGIAEHRPSSHNCVSVS